MKTTEMTYHRNGVSGVGFHVSYEPATATLTFQWPTTDYEAETWQEPIEVKLSALPIMNKPGKYEHRDSWSNLVCRVYDITEIAPDTYLVRFEDRNQGKFIGLWSPAFGREYGNVAFACICLDMLAARGVEFGFNSWRGDHYASALKGILPA